ncbi:MAG: hypothetical protein ACD_48C00082G0001, partial [uncultured bacterium]
AGYLFHYPFHERLAAIPFYGFSILVCQKHRGNDVLVPPAIFADAAKQSDGNARIYDISR